MHFSCRTLKSRFVGRACAAHDSVHFGVGILWSGLAGLFERSDLVSIVIAQFIRTLIVPDAV